MQPKITIVLSADGVNVEGPLQNKVLALGMLELAKALVIAYEADQKNESRIVVPAGPVPMTRR